MSPPGTVAPPTATPATAMPVMGKGDDALKPADVVVLAPTADVVPRKAAVVEPSAPMLLLPGFG